LLLDPGETRPFHADGARSSCQLSANLKEDGVVESCASFVPEIGWGRKPAGGGSSTHLSHPILLTCSSGRLVLASLRLERSNTIVLRISHVVDSVPHSIFNHSSLSLAFRQVGESNHSMDCDPGLIFVSPGQTKAIVWPQPSMDHRLSLVMINGIHIPSTSEVDTDDLKASVRVFEEFDSNPFGLKAHSLDSAQKEEALALELSTRLSQEGTRMVHVHIGQLLSLPSTAVSQPTGKTSFVLQLPALKVLLEDDVSLQGESEVLYLSVTGIHVRYETANTATRVTAEIKTMQLDNQFDVSTPFPVVLSVDPKFSPALKLCLESLNKDETTHLFYEKIHLDIGEGFVFIEDRLLDRIQHFVGGLTDGNDDQLASEQEEEDAYATSHGRVVSRQTLTANKHTCTTEKPAEQDAWCLLKHGVTNEIADVRFRVVSSALSASSPRAVQDVLKTSAATVGSDVEPFLHVESLRLGAVNLHLTLVIIDGALVRKHAGATIERMIHKVKLEDVLIALAPQHAYDLVLRKSEFVNFVHEMVVNSFKKSFVSGKFVLKAMNAWTDRALRVADEHGQKAGDSTLARRRPFRERKAQDLGPHISEDRFGISRFVGGVVVDIPRFAGRQIKKTVETGMSAAGKIKKAVL
jgi:hypothetical protein